ncbi:MAG TPA: hypothetical protein VFC05_08370 [Nitrososphaeraceae archaeon]|nr:hypothetical protein [Nitrososphaeraceae archaeon]
MLTLDNVIELGKIKLTSKDINDLKKFVSVFDGGLKGDPVDSKTIDLG